MKRKRCRDKAGKRESRREGEKEPWREEKTGKRNRRWGERKREGENGGGRDRKWGNNKPLTSASVSCPCPNRSALDGVGALKWFLSSCPGWRRNVSASIPTLATLWTDVCGSLFATVSRVGLTTGIQERKQILGCRGGNRYAEGDLLIFGQLILDDSLGIPFLENRKV